MSVKKIIVEGVEHQIDYTALENLPVIPPSPCKITFEHTVTEWNSKDPTKPKTIVYDGKIKDIEICRYACPEHIDDEPETHLTYLKDKRAIYARDGDFGFPEIDGTGQINFKPVFNTGYTEGYVVIPTVTPADGYNKFKSPYSTGIEGDYRLTKVNQDVSIELTAVEEASMPAYEITYKIVAPYTYGIPANEEDDSVTPIPNVRVFRCKDQTEKYATYILGDKPHSILSTALCSGELLTFTQDVDAPGPGLVGFTATVKACSDLSGLPSDGADGADEVGVYFNIEDFVPAEEGDTIKAVSSVGKVKDNKFIGKCIEEIGSDLTVTITIAPPVDVTYDDASVRVIELDPETGDPVLDKNGQNKIIYGFEMKDANKHLIYEATAPQGADLMFTVVRGYGINEVDPNNADLKLRPVADAIAEILDSITVDGVEQTLASIVKGVEASKNKDNFILNGSAITGDVVITLKTRPEAPAVEPAE